MNILNVTETSITRPLLLACAVAAAVCLASGMALAGECPADKVTRDFVHPGGEAPAGVTDTVLATIDLSHEKIAAEDRLLRLRRLEIAPGGVVPLHDHADRPAIIHIVEGSIVEFSSNCAVPIEHKAGEVAMESVGLRHWWRNQGDTTVVLFSSDILHVEQQDDPTM